MAGRFGDELAVGIDLLSKEKLTTLWGGLSFVAHYVTGMAFCCWNNDDDNTVASRIQRATEPFGQENKMPNFKSFSTKVLKRIVDQFPDHAVEVRVVLDQRSERFCMERAVAYLTTVAKDNRTVGYKDFTDHCTDGRTWAQMRNQVRFYLDDVQGYCIDTTCHFSPP